MDGLLHQLFFKFAASSAEQCLFEHREVDDIEIKRSNFVQRAPQFHVLPGLRISITNRKQNRLH